MTQDNKIEVVNEMKEIAKENSMTASQLKLIMKTVAKGASVDEFKMFMHICKKTGLDPFLKEIYFYKDNRGNSVIMTSRDGFLSIATKHPAYAGLVSCEVREGDDFEVDYGTMKVKHKHCLVDRDKKKIVGAWAVAYRKGTTPVVAWVDFSEFNKGKFVWASHPSMMIRKVAEVRALKNQYGIVGLATFEEMGVNSRDELEKQSDEVVDRVLTEDDFFQETLDKIGKEPKEKRVELLYKMLETVNFTKEQAEKITLKIKEYETSP